MDQPELPLEYPPVDQYVVELRSGPLHNEQTQRQHVAHTRADALNFIDALRDSAAQRDNVTWDGEEVDAAGRLYGMSPGGTVWLVVVTPPLEVE